jgi:hypothetical protein
MPKLFAAHGRMRSSRPARDLFLGKLEMEGHEARAAIAGLNGKELRGNVVRVGEKRKHGSDGMGHRRH